MEKLRVRVYNVRFGDAILVTVPDRASNGQVVERNILIDVGNVLGGEGGKDEVFKPILENVLQVLNGRPLDLYVMTHEHLDHVQGLPYAAQMHNLKMKVDCAWLTKSSEPGYYDQHSEAKKKKLQLEAAYRAALASFSASPRPVTPQLRALLNNNNPKDTGDCVEFLRKLANNTFYVYRGLSLQGKHPFQEAQLEIWAPEEDTSVYYGKFQPFAVAAAGVDPGSGPDQEPAGSVPLPPPGVDAGAFYDLVEMRSGHSEAMLAIDAAANNTSVVLCLKWQGWTLIFPGDAEVRSWKEMNKHNLLQPVHLLKVGHHGSHNGTPPTELLEKILPLKPKDKKKRSAVVSTCLDTYPGVPHEPTRKELEKRCKVRDTLSLGDGKFFDLFFRG